MPPKKGFKIPSEEFPDLGALTPSKNKQPARASSPSSTKKTAKDALKSEPVYFRKEAIEAVTPISLEDYQQWKNPWAIKERYLEKQNFPIRHGQYWYIYEAILTETQSVNITHFHTHSKNPQLAISHSKCYIMKIRHPYE